MRRFLKWHFLLGFPNQNFVSISRFPRPITDLPTLITRDEYELYRSSLRSFILLAITSSVLQIGRSLVRSQLVSVDFSLT